MTTIPLEFYARPPDVVARALLGKILVCTVRGVRCAGRIVETEAYFADGDPACHAARGVTARTRTMFGPPGRAYVYFCYGNHWLMNAVTEEEGRGSAVLIRALEPLEGIAVMRRRRGVTRDFDVTNGPGKLCAALGITGRFNNAPLDAGALRIMDDGHHVATHATSARIGIRVGTALQARFFVPGNGYVSGRMS
jgi:DNA-3-methyladenine glycosylase